MRKHITFGLVLSFFAVFWAPVMAQEIPQKTDKSVSKLESNSKNPAKFSQPALDKPDKKGELVLDTELLAKVFGKNTFTPKSTGALPPEGPAVPEPPKPTIPDPLAFMKGFGKSGANLFSGSLGFEYQLTLPSGRGSMSSSLALNYSSQDKNFSSQVGYGWSMPVSNIHRFQSRGVDKIYDRDDFVAEINGKNTELISIDSAANYFGAKTEGGFYKFIFNNNEWIVTDPTGNKYFFGTTLASRQENPANSAETYKWMLERMEDLDGNFVTFSYTKDQGQIYPNTIRYTGNGSDLGIYEVQFVFSPRPEYIEYKRGFAVTTAKVLSSVQIFSRDSGALNLVYQYDLTHNFANNAVAQLTKIQQRKGSEVLPATNFEYYDGSELGDTKRINLLSKISQPYGAEEVFTYKPDTAYKIGAAQANPIPFIVHTLYQHKKRANVANPWNTTSYSYEGGHYYYDNLDAYKKEYAGFHKVTKTDPVGNFAKFYFHQNEFSLDNVASSLNGEYQDHIAKKGRQYRSEIYDDSGNLYQTKISKWEKQSLLDDDPEKDRYFIKNSREITTDYDGNASGRSKAQTFTYDQWGNVAESVDWGEVTLNAPDGSFTDISSDKITTTTDYIYNVADYLYKFARRTESRDISNNIIAEKEFYYDDLPSGQVDKGHLTKEKVLVSPGNYIQREFAYNSYGLPTVLQNFRGISTTMSYGIRNLFPQNVTNALGQVVSYVYDMRFGVASETTDPNGSVSQTIYDDFGRMTEQKVSDPVNPANLVTQKKTFYDLFATNPSITESAYTQNGGIEIDSRTYFDGFGRPIQTRQETEGAENFIVTNTEYDELGNTKKTTLPVIQSSGINYQNFAGSAVGINYIYDTLQRNIETTDSVGTRETVYDNWAQIKTDRKGNKKELHSDARGKLITVVEYLDGNPYETSYKYNSAGNLINIQDALQNEKNFKYDLLGRKLSEEMLHKIGDPTFGTWNYEYDQNGNMTKRKDPRNIVTRWQYDDLDRVTSEDDIATPQTEISYKYDVGANGIGKLSAVFSTGAEDQYQYDILGRKIGEKREMIVDGESFKTKFSYDLLGNILTIDYPHRSQSGLRAHYKYNQAGQLDGISRENTNTGAVKSVIDNLDYGPTGVIVREDFGNGVRSENFFDINNLYLLDSKSTTNGSLNLQRIRYGYDQEGNILGIKDSSETDASKKTSYKYDDLYRLINVRVDSSANGNDYDYNYKYDIIGNMLQKVNEIYNFAGNSVATSAATIASPHAVTSTGSNNYDYDENGNLVRDNFWKHRWDYGNKMHYSDNGTLRVKYFYDHTGNRVMKTTNAGEKNFYVNKYFDYEDGKPKYYFFAGNQKSATIRENGALFSTTYHHEDHLTGGNVDTDRNGDMIQLLDYYPYGEIRIDDQLTSVDNDFKFTGKEKDDETELYYYGARYYDSGVARFISRDNWAGDLSDPQSLNKYSYVRNNPVKYVDPSGNVFILGSLLKGTGYLAKHSTRGLLAVATHGSQLVYPVASKQFRHSLQSNPPTINKDNTPDLHNDISDKIANSSEYSSLESSFSGSLIFNSEFDLEASIKKANISYDNETKSAKVIDNYNFKKGDAQKSSRILSAVNDAAAFLQKKGVLNPYDIDIDVSPVGQSKESSGKSSDRSSNSENKGND